MTPERWQRVEEVFHAAIERDAGSRDGFLAEACAGDEELRKEVESLLHSDGQADDFIEAPAAAAFGELESAGAAKLSAAERLGPYEVVELIGRGGMGEVYRARDTRLGRDVAIKVLPSLTASDPDRLRRLELEARTAGMLNHPNILSIYDTGVHDGSPYLVTELLTGKTLRELLAAEAVPARKALEIAAQIARGLAAAHDKGIVHRDLKPENVFVTKEGHVKILDFGLAKLIAAGRRGPGGFSEMPTMSGATVPGVIVGTVGYMSPEQVRGEPVDHRSDMFSFGAILYEMLTGRRAFGGDSAVETMHAILKEEPPEPSSAVRIAPPVERILRRCLEKRPDERFQSARDLGFALEALSVPSRTDEVTKAAAPARRSTPLLKTAVAAVLAAAVAALAAFLAMRLTKTEPPVFQRLSFRRGIISSARFSPDGQTVVYAGAFAGRPTELFATRPGSPESRSFELGEADVLGISTSGEMAVRLAAEWTLARVPLVGGAPRELMKSVAAADWSPDGGSLAIVRHEATTQVLEYPLGTKLYETANELWSPRVAPDGDSVAFLETPRFSTGSIVCRVDRSGRKRVLATDAGFEGGLGWSGRDELVYMSHRLGVASTLNAIEPGGKPRPILTLDGYVRLLDVDRSGRALLVRDDVRTQVLLRGPEDAGEREVSWLDSSYAAGLSDDGTLILMVEDGAGGGPERATYLRRTDGSPAVRLGEGGGLDLSPDGSSVLLLKPGPSPELWLMPAGAGSPRRVPTAPIVDLRMATWFADGRRILVIGAEAGHEARAYVLETNGASPPRPITPERTTVAMSSKTVSPDGRLLAARTRGQAFLYPVDGGEPRAIPNLAPREEPLRFSADGSALYSRVRGLPTRIFRLDLATGKKDLWKELLPADPAGVRAIQSVVLTPDARTYAYTFQRVLSGLYSVDLRR